MARQYQSGSGTFVNETDDGLYQSAGGAFVIGTSGASGGGSPDATANGATLTATATLVPGTATGTGDAVATGATLIATSSLIAGAATGTSQGTAAGATLTGISSLIAGTATADNSGTIASPVLKNNTGTILANEVGVIVNVYNATTGALVVQKTGQTSDASGIVTVTDALIVAGATYAYEVVLASHGRRLPTAAAT